MNTINMSNTIDNSEIEDKVTNFEKNFIKFQLELKIFEYLKSGHKVMMDTTTNILYSEPPSYFQWMKRWWYGEDKERTFDYLDNIFTQFMKFLDTILTYIHENKYCPRVIILNKRICAYINKIIPGLCSLKYTYPKYKEIHCKVGSIVITLIDFKKETQKFGGNNHKKIRSFEI